MRIIEPTVTLLKPADYAEGILALQVIETFARISHRSEGQQTAESWKRFIPAVVMDHGDWSVVEHAWASAIFRVDRGVTHELVRHRLFSYTQESTRFVNGRKSYPNGLEVIKPVELMTALESTQKEWAESIEQAEQTYLSLLDYGKRPQEARSVLPNALASTIAVTGNLRNWRHFLLMRTSKETHPDFRRVTIPLLAIFKERVPLLFDDIEPEARQIDNLRKPR